MSNNMRNRHPVTGVEYRDIPVGSGGDAPSRNTVLKDMLVVCLAAIRLTRIWETRSSTWHLPTSLPPRTCHARCIVDNLYRGLAQYIEAVLPFPIIPSRLTAAV